MEHCLLDTYDEDNTYLSRDLHSLLNCISIKLAVERSGRTFDS